MKKRKYQVVIVTVFLAITLIGVGKIKKYENNSDISALLSRSIQNSSIENIGVQALPTVVTTLAEFHAALDDVNVSQIELGANITGDQYKGPYTRNLEINGMELYTLDMGAFNVKFSTGVTVSLKGITLLGSNIYGPIIFDSGVAESVINYENIEYTGAQLGYNENGSINFSGTNIINVTSASEEVVEASYITMKTGSDNTFTLNDDAFWLKTITNPIFKVEDNVNLKVTTNHVFYGSGIIIEIGQNSTVLFEPIDRTSVFTDIQDLTIGNNSTFTIKGSGTNGPLFETNGDITIQPGAILDLQSVGSGYNILMKMNKNTSKINLADTATLKMFNNNLPLLNNIGDINLAGNEVKGWVSGDIGGIPTDRYADVIGKMTRNNLTTTLPNSTDAPTFNTTFATENYSEVHFLPGVKAMISATSTAQTLEAANTTTPDITTLFGVSAIDSNSVDITDQITYVGTPADLSVPGIYPITANVLDVNTKSATPVVLTLTIADTTPPVITILNQNLVNEVSDSPLPDFNLLFGATAIDTLDGNLTNNIRYTGLPTDMAIPGVYAITANLSDTARNNAVPVIFNFLIVDTTNPVITTTLNENTYAYPVSAIDFFADYTINATDNLDGDISANVIVDDSLVDYTKPGTYTVNLNVNDSSNNIATKAITVIITDDVAPVLTAQITTATIEATNVDVDLITLFGISAIDNVEGDVTNLIVFNVQNNIRSFAKVMINNPISYNIPGLYTINVSSLDASFNETIITITLTIVDTTAPTITFNTDTVILFVGSNQQEAINLLGASVSDVADSTSSLTYDFSNVNFNMSGTYKTAATAIDVNNNKTIKEFKVIIKEKSLTSTGLTFNIIFYMEILTLLGLLLVLVKVKKISKK